PAVLPRRLGRGGLGRPRRRRRRGRVRPAARVSERRAPGIRRPSGHDGGGGIMVKAFCGILVSAGIAITLASATGTSDAAGGLAFGHAVVVDHQRVTGEPSLSISPTSNTRGH